MKDALGRQRDVHDLREGHPQDRQEQLHAGATHVKVLHRRDADDRRRVNGLFSVGDGGDVKHRIRLGQGVVAGVVTERTRLTQGFGGVDVAFDHDVSVGRNLEVVGFALHHLYRLSAEVAGEQEFIQPVRHRRGRAKRKHRVAAEEDGHRHPLAGFIVAASVTRGDFLQLPMHAGGRVVVNLHAIHAEVAVAGVGVARDDAGQRDKAPAVERPALEDRQVKQRRRLRV